ncbi:hypothetical protein KZC52_09595 [Microbacterium sp. kSW2-24]|uniref:hypothetical protein n=1 Tax=Microbacterium galbinum TaxID=2851646 RepID=UPI001FFC9381|nr:hypothetical protein [Microbacterium galbinum]MCK2023176.1 hypothetical protein [Microbacterium galbinum]
MAVLPFAFAIVGAITRLGERAEYGLTPLLYSPWMPALIATFLTAYVAFFWILWDRQRRRRYFRLKQDFGIADELQERERNLADSGEPLSLAALWSVTQERIEYYHRIVTTQSEVSFKNGAVTSYVGFGLLLVLAIIGALTARDAATSITLGSLGAVGAALAGYLGATFMKIQAESSAQLRQFFSQPVEFSKLLGVERLIESLPPEERAASVQLVVRAMMRENQSTSESN